jgi:hypothetical protein
MNKNQTQSNSNTSKDTSKDTSNSNTSNSNDETKSVVMSLEMLSKEYDTILIKYNQAQKDYFTFLQSQSSNMACSKYNSDSKEINQACYDEIWKKAGCTTTGIVSASGDWWKDKTLNDLIYDSFLWATETDSTHRDGCYGTTTDTSVYSTATEPNYNINTKSLVDIKGTTYWGSNSLNEGAATSVEDCKALCSSDKKCTGATFNSDKQYCWTRSGNGAISPGLENDYAIIPENLKHLKIIKSLSEKLNTINDKILQVMNHGQPLYSEQDMMRKSQTIVLNSNYKKLMKEREKVDKIIKKYKDLETSQDAGATFINEKYAKYIMYITISIIIICLCIKFLPTATENTSNQIIQQGGSLSKKTYIFVFILSLIVLIINKLYI